MEHCFKNPVRVAGGGALIASLPALAGSSVALESSFEEPDRGGESVSCRLTPPFRRVDLSVPARTTVTVGNRRSVVLHGDEGLLGEIATSVAGDTLSVSATRTLSSAPGLVVSIVVPTLESVALASGGSVEVRGVCGQSFEVHLTGSGILSARGQVARLHVDVLGAGIAQLDRMMASDVRVQVSGSGSARVRALRSLTARLGGGGSIYYGGNPATVTREGLGLIAPL